MDNNPPPNNVIPLFKKKNALESSLYEFFRTDPFYASFLQEIAIQYNEQIPTAAMTYNKEKNEFKMLLNPNFFTSLELQQRVAILHHETLHFMNQHLFRFFQEGLSEDEEKKQMIATDLAINQYINNLPSGGAELKMFKQMVNGKVEPFPEKKPADVYLELLKDEKNQEVNKDALGKFQGTDEHMWGDLSEDEKERMLTEAKKIVERTIEKSSTTH